MLHAFKAVRLSNATLSGQGGALLYSGNTMATQAYVTGVSGALAAQMSASTAGVSSLNTLTGGLTLTGFGNITVTTSGTSYLVVSGATGTLVAQNMTGAYANTFYPLVNNPSAYVTLTSGDARYIPANNTSGFVTTGQTGQFVSVNSTGNFITSAQTGQFLWTGNQQAFTTAIPVGVDVTGISFPFVFNTTPKVLTTVEVTGDVMYAATIRNRTTSGFQAMFSDTIQEGGVVLHTFASL